MSETVYPKFRWYVLITVLVATVAQGVLLISPSPLVGEISKSLGVDLGAVTGAVMGAYTLFVALAAIVGGALIDKFGIVRTYIFSLLLMIVSSLLIPVVGKTLGGLILLRILQGCGSGPIMCAVTKVAADWFPESERAIVTGIQGMGVSLGTAVGFAAAPAVFVATSSWHAAMSWMAVGSFIALAMTLVLAFGPKPPVNAAELPVDRMGSGAKDFKLAISQPVTWLCVASIFALSWVLQGYNDLTPGHLAVQPPAGLGMGPMAAGQIMMLYQIAFMVGSVASGFVVDKLFGGKAKSAVSLSYLLTAVFCVSVMLPAVSGSKGILILCLILAGFFMGMPNPIVMAFISRYYPEHITGKVGGMALGLGIFGGTVGVAAGSMALHSTGMYNVSIIIVGVIALIGVFIGLGLQPPKAFVGIDGKSVKV